MSALNDLLKVRDRLTDCLHSCIAVLGDRVRDGSATDDEIEAYEEAKSAVSGDDKSDDDDESDDESDDDEA